MADSELGPDCCWSRKAAAFAFLFSRWILLLEGAADVVAAAGAAFDPAFACLFAAFLLLLASSVAKSL